MVQESELSARMSWQCSEPLLDISPPDSIIAILRHNHLKSLGVSFVLGLPTPEGTSVAKVSDDAQIAVMMLLVAHTQVEMKSHYDRLLREWSRDQSPFQREGMTAARSMVRKLRQTGVDFILVWRVRDLPGVRLDYSQDLGPDRLQRCLVTMSRGIVD